jgi:transposase
VTDDLTPIPYPDPPPDPIGRAAFWRGAVADFAASGLSVRAFCLARGLTERKFYTWRKNLGLSPVGRPTPTSDAPIRPFVPVRVVADSSAEVVLPGGVTLRVPVSSDPSHVARLVAALRGATC